MAKKRQAETLCPWPVWQWLHVTWFYSKSEFFNLISLWSPLGAAQYWIARCLQKTDVSNFGQILYYFNCFSPHRTRTHSPTTDHGRKRKNVLSWKETFCREERNNCQAQDRVLVEKVKCWAQPAIIHWIITWLLFSLWITLQSTVSNKIDKGMTWVCAVLFWKTK